MDKLHLRKWLRMLAFVCVTSATLGVLMAMAAVYSPEVQSELTTTRTGRLVSKFFDLYDVIGRHPGSPYNPETRTITLAVGQSVDLERIRITYRGLAPGNRFKVETLIPDFDREMSFRHEFESQSARQGFRLYRDEFELIAAKEDRLKLRLVSDYRQ